MLIEYIHLRQMLNARSRVRSGSIVSDYGLDDRAFTPGERTPGTHFTGGWVGPRADLDTEARGEIL
jgi:hypothetical protein